MATNRQVDRRTLARLAGVICSAACIWFILIELEPIEHHNGALLYVHHNALAADAPYPVRERFSNVSARLALFCSELGRDGG